MGHLRPVTTPKSSPGIGLSRGPVTPTVEIYPQNRRKTPISWVYLYSERITQLAIPAVAPIAFALTLTFARGRLCARGRLRADPHVRPRSPLRPWSPGTRRSPVTLTVEIFPQKRRKTPFSWEYLDSERISQLALSAVAPVAFALTLTSARGRLRASGRLRTDAHVRPRLPLRPCSSSR